jgi:putative acetyltransferase
MPPPPALLREYLPSDFPGVAAVYRDAVRQIAPGLYTPEQIHAWAAFADQPRDLATLLSQGYRLVVENDTGGIDAFAVLDPADYVSLLYSRVSRQGHGSRLLDALEAEASRRSIVRVRTAASLISHPLFLRHGYTVDHPETVERHGVSFDRYRMSKRL